MMKVRQTKYGTWMIADDSRVYDAYNTKSNEEKRRTKALEDLDKHRGWKSLWDIENESSKKKTHR